MKKSKFSFVFILAFFLLLNFCNTQALTFSDDFTSHHKSPSFTTESEHEKSFPAEHSHSSQNKEEVLCCSMVKATAVVPFRFQINSNRVIFYNFPPLFTSLNTAFSMELAKIRQWLFDLGPPQRFLKSSFFYEVFSSHAPPLLFV